MFLNLLKIYLLVMWTYQQNIQMKFLRSLMELYWNDIWKFLANQNDSNTDFIYISPFTI